MSADVDVVIAGAGPVGTVAAYALLRAGVSVRLLESNAACIEDLRASTFHPPTLEMLDELGVLDDLIPMGLKAPEYQYRIRKSGEVLAFDLTEIADVTRFPFRLQCEQYKLARLLAAKLADHIAYSRRVVHFEQDADGVTVNVEAPHDIERYRAKYLIAADGANSIVRKWLGVAFDGFTYPEKFLCLSTTTPLEDHFDRLAYVNYVSDPEDWHVLLRVPTLWRVLVPADENTPDDELRSDARKVEVFDKLIGAGEAVDTAHRTIYRVHQRVAQSYTHGRVLLTGDAAHLNNPLGGLGMNSGIHDAINLVEKLVRILGGGDAAAELDRYDRQRRTVMNDFIQAQTIKNKKLIELREPEAKNEQYEEMRLINRDPARRRDYLYTQAMFKSLDDARAIA